MALTLRLLGGFEARLDDGAPIVFPRKKAQALLAYLALHPDRAHSRSSLATLLWDDLPEAAARASVRQALASIRRALPDPESPLVADSDSVRLESHALTLDVALLEKYASEGTLPELEAAATLYRGPLLSGLGAQSSMYEEWLLSARERLHELAVDVLGRLLARQTELERVDAAVQTGLRLLSLDPLQEPVHRALMRLHLKQGRRASALRQYQACVDVVRRELGIDPESPTIELYRELVAMSDEPSIGPVGRNRSTPAPATRLPILGRDTEVEHAADAVLSAIGGHGRVLLIVGEAGVGKTRFVSEILDRTTGREARVLSGRCYESEQILPFGVWVQALRSSGVFSERDAFADLEPIWRVELSRLFPELPPGPPASTTAEGNAHLFEAIVQVLTRLCTRRPVVVVLEDVHWADTISWRLLPFVARRIAALPLLLVATLREEDIADANDLSVAMTEILAEPHARVIPLAPLSRADIAQLVIATAGPRARDARVAEHAWTLSEGNPFVALETIRAFEEGADTLVAARMALPDRVRELIRRRVRPLGASARHVAAAASVIGREFDFRLLREAVGTDDEQAAEGLEELVRRRLVRLAGDEFAFVHDRIRQNVYDDLLLPRRVALHHAVARAIERVWSDRLDEVYDRLGHHYSHTDDAERAISYLALFATQAGARYALADAVQALDDARSRVDRLPVDMRARRLTELLVEEAGYLFFLGRFGVLVDLLGRHEERLGQAHDAALEGRYYFWLGLTLSLIGRHVEASANAARALAAAERASDVATQGRAHAVLALDGFWTGRALDGAAAAERAIALLATTDDEEWTFFAYFYLAVNRIQLGEVIDAADANRQALAIAQRTQSRRLGAFVAWSTGWIETALGDTAAAGAACRRGTELAPDPLGHANALGFLGYALLESGDAHAAIEALDQAVARSAHFGFRPQQGWFSGWLAEAHLMAGDRSRARDCADESLAIARQVGFPYGVGVALRAKGRLALAVGDLEAADTMLAEAVAVFGGISARFDGARARLDLARVCQRRGESASAQEHCADAREVLARLRLHAWVARASGLALELAGS